MPKFLDRLENAGIGLTLLPCLHDCRNFLLSFVDENACSSMMSLQRSILAVDSFILSVFFARKSSEAFNGNYGS